MLLLRVTLSLSAFYGILITPDWACDCRSTMPPRRCKPALTDSTPTSDPVRQSCSARSLVGVEPVSADLNCRGEIVEDPSCTQSGLSRLPWNVLSDEITRSSSTVGLIARSPAISRTNGDF